MYRTVLVLRVRAFAVVQEIDPGSVHLEGMLDNAASQSNVNETVLFPLQSSAALVLEREPRDIHFEGMLNNMFLVYPFA